MQPGHKADNIMDLTELVVGIGSAKAVVKTTQAAVKATSSAVTKASSELRGALNKAKGVTSAVSTEERLAAKLLRRQTRSQLTKMNSRKGVKIRRAIDPDKLPGLKPNIQLFASEVEDAVVMGEGTATKALKEAMEFLGENPRTITTNSGDKIFLSADGTRKIRFDINKTIPHENPHMHIEELVSGKWKSRGGQIYPCDVPHK